MRKIVAALAAAVALFGAGAGSASVEAGGLELLEIEYPVGIENMAVWSSACHRLSEAINVLERRGVYAARCLEI